jgi:multiple antibiotic resistance protein
MFDYIQFSIAVFAGFFAIMNPIGGIPVFISLTEGLDYQAKQRVAKKSTFVAFLIGFSFIVFGTYLFKFFGITIPSFKITGGAILFYTGFEMLQSKQSSVKHLKNPVIDENIAISPLAIPLLAGPGTIVTGMNYVSNTNFIHILIVIFIFAIICLLNYIAFKASNYITNLIGNNIITVISKIMGLIIAIIGTQMIIKGISLSFNL